SVDLSPYFLGLIRLEILTLRIQQVEVSRHRLTRCHQASQRICGRPLLSARCFQRCTQVGGRKLIECNQERRAPREVAMQSRSADADGRGNLVLGSVRPPSEEIRRGTQYDLAIMCHDTIIAHMRRICLSCASCVTLQKSPQSRTVVPTDTE